MLKWHVQQYSVYRHTRFRECNSIHWRFESNFPIATLQNLRKSFGFEVDQFGWFGNNDCVSRFFTWCGLALSAVMERFFMLSMVRFIGRIVGRLVVSLNVNFHHLSNLKRFFWHHLVGKARSAEMWLGRGFVNLWLPTWNNCRIAIDFPHKLYTVHSLSLQGYCPGYCTGYCTASRVTVLCTMYSSFSEIKIPPFICQQVKTNGAVGHICYAW